MQIIRADHMGMCFGVRDAIALAVGRAEAEPLTILGQLVHNATVLTDLQARGIAIAPDPDGVETRTVMVTAHGASERKLATARARGLTVLEATCPLVRVVHRAIAALIRDGYHPIVVGQRGHVEVLGLTEDLAEYDVVLADEDVRALGERSRIGVVAQTTQPIDRVRRLVGLIRERFPAADVRFIDTVCLPTKQRQDAAHRLARLCDVVVVIGGANSNNTRELVKTCGRYGSRVHHVETEADLRLEWFDDAETVGITAGTSTPDRVIDCVEQRIREIDADREQSRGGELSRGFRLQAEEPIGRA